MTEEEWEATRNLTKMVQVVDLYRFDRKLRLFAVGCCRRVSAQIRDPDALSLLDLIEELADDMVDLHSVRQVYARVRSYPHAEGAIKSATALDCASWRASANCYLQAAKEAEDAAADATNGDDKTAPMAKFEERVRERSIQVAMLRDVIGNPFRPVTLNPTWLTSTVLALASGIYSDRAFDRMPILADALQDAGCDNGEILNHCRQPGEHVRGCWCVDLILNKS